MKSFLDLLDRFRKIHLLVVGDLMLDHFVWGDVERISPEAPVPVLRVTSESSRLGGAANVIHNIRSLGGKVSVCGIIGRDAAGRQLLQGLQRIGASTQGVFSSDHSQTTQKSRIIARPRHQQIVRLDRESRDDLREMIRRKIRDFVVRQVSRCDGLVVSDYGKGVIHEALLADIADMAGKKKIICVIDPKRENYSRYRLPTLITPNKEEAGEASGIDIRDEASLVRAGERLVRLWEASAVLITRGPDGMSLFRPRGSVKHFPTEPRDVFDVTGAGDTVVAACSLALASGASYEEAAVIANLAAGVVGEEVGTVAVAWQKLRKIVREKR